jgi:hypothetical protein
MKVALKDKFLVVVITSFRHLTLKNLKSWSFQSLKESSSTLVEDKFISNAVFMQEIPKLLKSIAFV